MAVEMWKIARLLCTVLVCSVELSRGFNLDTFNYVKQSGAPNSMFGFSVATHSDRGQTWTIIGAPEADSQQPGVYQSGLVYRCRTDRDDSCQDLPFDRQGNLNDSSGRQIDMKSNQWFGATVNSGGPDKPIVACAPRYVWFASKLDRRDPVGTCYLAKGDFTDFHEYSPCRTKNWGYHRQGACQAGLGAAVSKDGETLFIGAPGSWYWQGQMYSLDPTVHHKYTSYIGEYGSTGQAYGQSLKDRPSVLATKEGSPLDDDSYMGYSLAVGDFTGDGQSGAAIGMPRGNSKDKRLVGKVVLYTWNLTNHQNITGEQLGSYFGYAIATADIDGDDYDDIVIGAPLYTEPNNEGKYEVGRVYVRYQRSNKFKARFQKLHTRDGVNSKGRFGLSLASLGDLDLDGYDDIAIGAPYDGPNERGAVYIYYGSSEGLREKPSQIIKAEDVAQTNLYTFGFSVAGNNVDLDNNQYPDMVVGSYLSDTAIVFKSRPVIKLYSSVLFNTANKIISLDDRSCSLRGEPVTCTEIKTCFYFNGTGVNRHVDLNVQLSLDAKNQKDPRMFFLNHERQHIVNQTWRLEEQIRNCKTERIYMKDGVRDKLTPLEVEMKYSLKEDSRAFYRRSTTNVLPPLLDRNMPAVYKDRITIRKNCGSDDICIPNLRLISNPNVEKYLLGSNKRLEIDVIVQNEGEDSFESMFYMRLPPGVNYFKTERIGDSGDIPVQCSAPTVSTNHTLKCDIGNPLPAERMVHFKVLLDPYHEEGMAQSYDFMMAVNSTNPEDEFTTSDNEKHLTVNIWVETNLSPSGWASPPDVHYNVSHFENIENYTVESDIGPQFVHWYVIKNEGPSLINQATAHFIWPDKTLAGDDLLYLMEQPETSGPIKCEYAFANPLKVTMDRKKSYLESFGIGGEHSGSSGSSVSYGTSSHIETSHDRRKNEDDRIEDSGDGSFVHETRGKERNQAGEVISSSSSHHSSSSSSSSSSSHQMSGGGSSSSSAHQMGGASGHVTGGASGHVMGGASGHVMGGASSSHHMSGASGQQMGVGSSSGHHTGGAGGTIEKTWTTSWNSSGQGPVVTHSWNKTTIIGEDGVAREVTHTSTGSDGQIIYHHSGGRGGQQSGSHTGSRHQFASGQQESHNTEDSRNQHFVWNGGVSREQSGHQSGHQSGTREHSGASREHSGAARGQSGTWESTREQSGGSRSSFEQSGQTSGRGQTGTWEHSGSRGQTSGSGRQEGSFGASGQGQGHNVTHKISWTIDGQRENQDGGNGMKFYNSFVTEESVNQGIEDYTQEILHARGQNRGQNRHSSQEAHYGATGHTSGSGSHTSGSRTSGSGSQASGHASGSRTSGAQSSGRDRSTYGKYNQSEYDATSGIGGAAIGGGFRTTALDLGVLSNANVGENLSGNRDSNYETNYEYSGEVHYDPDLGSYEDKQYGGHSGVSYGTSRTYSGGRQASGERGRTQGNTERHYSHNYDSNGGRNYETHSSSHSQSSHSSQGTQHGAQYGYPSGDNVPTQYPAHAPNRHYRQKRQIDDDAELAYKCNATMCRTLKCVAGPMKKGEEVYVLLRFRANAKTIKKLGTKGPIEFPSVMRARIDRLPYIGTPVDRPVHTQQVVSIVTPTDLEVKVDVVPLWVVVLSACAGAAILLLLVFLLYKCGFFKRNRPSDAPERQPLNRNGHYNGDEQL